MKLIAIRFFMIASLLVSLQTSADMLVTMNHFVAINHLVAMDHAVQIQASAMPHCADMAGMSNTDKQPATSADKHQCERCNTGCCMSFLSITTSNIVPVIHHTQRYQELPVQLPFRFTNINDRPPIFS